MRIEIIEGDVKLVLSSLGQILSVLHPQLADERRVQDGILSLRYLQLTRVTNYDEGLMAEGVAGTIQNFLTSNKMGIGYFGQRDKISQIP